jgi:uncharacterized protein YndB with AHSA1/START domain
MKWILRIAGVFAALLAVSFGGLFVASHRSGAGKLYAEIKIAQPREKVFAWVTEPALLKEWVSGYISETPLYGCPTVVGSKGMVTMNLDGEKWNFVTTVLEFQKDQHLKMRFQGAEFNMVLNVAVEDTNGGSKVKYATETEYKKPIYHLLEPIIAWSAQNKIKTDLSELRSKTEAPISSSGLSPAHVVLPAAWQWIGSFEDSANRRVREGGGGSGKHPPM